MKHFKTLIPVIMAVSLLAGCKIIRESDTSSGSDSTETVSSSDSAEYESFSDTPSYADSTTSGSIGGDIGNSSLTSSLSVSTSSDTSNSWTPPQKEPTEIEQVLKLLSDYGNFYHNDTFSFMEKTYDDIIDKTQTIYVDNASLNNSEEAIILDGDQLSIPTDSLGSDFSAFYKVSESWLERFDSMLTERMKREFIRENYDRCQEYEGGIYIQPGMGTGGYGLGMSYLRLDSVEKPDENTVVLNVTSVGDKDDWGLDKDIEESSSVTIVRTADGLRVDKCSNEAARWFGTYSEISYGDISISF